ncbi:MAG: STAS domain-containing protein [Actinomycetota bacterium]|nr:STAS domain-containing protein [Actinomycetota bacterium]
MEIGSGQVHRISTRPSPVVHHALVSCLQTPRAGANDVERTYRRRQGHLGVMTSSPDYSIVIAQELATVVVSVQGELDDNGLMKLEAILAELIGHHAHLVTVDAAAMSLADPSGARVFRRARKWAHQRGGVFTVKEPSESVSRALQASGLTDVVQVMADGPQEGTASRSSSRRGPRVVPEGAPYLRNAVLAEGRWPRRGHRTCP